jgi:hypothetical protein
MQGKTRHSVFTASAINCGGCVTYSVSYCGIIVYPRHWLDVLPFPEYSAVTLLFERISL